MRIAVNLRQYFHGKIGGMENYVRNVVGGLDRHRLTIWVHEEEVDHVHEFAPCAEVVGISHRLGLETIEKGLRTGTFDVYFCPLLVLEPLVVDLPSAVMMPDVQHEFFPEFFEPHVLQWRRQNYGPTALNADVLFTLSEHAKSTIAAKFGIEPHKIHVVHLDADAEFKRPCPLKPSRAFQELRLPSKYLYFPANFWPHKNHDNVLRALRLVLDRGHADLKLVLSGSPAGVDGVKKLAATLNLTKNVHFAGYLNRSLVPEVYRHSQALLFATKFEGFGIPLLEAFYCQTAAITSNAGSCVEVAGDAAALVDPLSPESIAEGIQRVLEDPEFREDLIRKGSERVRQFSWDRAVEITDQKLRSIADDTYVRPTRIVVEQWPRIGIVTPTYNMGRYIEETIQSVLSQDYPNLDYVVMDGGSKDDTIEILRKYEGKLRWCSERDEGQGDAINKGWHALSGSVFAYLNSDDTYLPGALATVAKHFKSNPGVGLIYGEAYHVDVDGKVIDRYPTQPFSLHSLASQCYICQPAAFMLREAFGNVGMINVTMHYALDYELWFRIARQYGVRKVDEYLATSRMHMDNKTLSSRRRVYQEIISTVRDHYGYVPYEWVHGYSCFLIDRKDQFFDRSRPSMLSYVLSLGLGFYHNPRNVRRYFAEWRQMTGIGGQFTGRWDDGWISRRYISERDVDGNSDLLRIEGKHWAPIQNLTLRVELDGRSLTEKSISNSGPFILELPLPEDVRGKHCQMVIESDRTWCPRSNGDFRQLSCVIDSIQFASHGNRK
jgi:glycosyltransferase involved in cell wall biosynthesis